MKMMKVAVALCVLFVSGASYADRPMLSSADIAQIRSGVMSAQETMLDLINWKVGDTMNYSLDLGGMNLGTMTMSATKDEDKAVWVTSNTDISMMGQKDVVEMLISRVDGKTLKMIHNGKEEQVPDQNVEIVSQDYTSITVPAGTFKCMHVVAKSKDVQHMEIWANPQATALMGMLQQSMDSQMGTVTVKLTSFKKN